MWRFTWTDCCLLRAAMNHLKTSEECLVLFRENNRSRNALLLYGCWQGHGPGYSPKRSFFRRCNVPPLACRGCLVAISAPGCTSEDLPLYVMYGRIYHSCTRKDVGSANLYPTYASVSKYRGFAGSSSSFLRNCRTNVRRYSTSSPYSGPQTEPRSCACWIRTPALDIM